jgi:probable rRNA maturation factor
MINLLIHKKYQNCITNSRLVDVFNQTLKVLKVQLPCDVTLLITNNYGIRKLNKKYRHINKATDVLSFNGEYVNLETGIPYIGDIVISYPKAKFNSKHKKHSIDDEIELLLIHGLLHLFGFDHDNALHKSKMWETQTKILSQINNPIDLSKV